MTSSIKQSTLSEQAPKALWLGTIGLLSTFSQFITLGALVGLSMEGQSLTKVSAVAALQAISFGAAALVTFLLLG